METAGGERLCGADGVGLQRFASYAGEQRLRLPSRRVADDEDTRHPAWGYVVYPPITPFQSWLGMQLFGPELSRASIPDGRVDVRTCLELWAARGRDYYLAPAYPGVVCSETWVNGHAKQPRGVCGELPRAIVIVLGERQDFGEKNFERCELAGRATNPYGVENSSLKDGTRFSFAGDCGGRGRSFGGVFGITGEGQAENRKSRAEDPSRQNCPCRPRIR